MLAQIVLPGLMKHYGVLTGGNWFASQSERSSRAGRTESGPGRGCLPSEKTPSPTRSSG
jgi:hypothetical protein